MEESNDINDNDEGQTKADVRRYIKYDGNLPERFSLKDDSKIDFTEDDVENAFANDEIDVVDKTFLLNVLNEYRFKKDVIKKINEYRQKISEGVQPGEELFIYMQKLELKHHPVLDKDKGLNLEGYALPVLDFEDAIINGRLNLNRVIVEGDVSMNVAKIRGDLNQSGMKVFGDIEQESITVIGNLNQNDMKVFGEINQDDAIVGRNWSQDGMKIIPELNQRGDNEQHGDDNEQNVPNHIEEEEVSDVVNKNENSGTIYFDAMRSVDKKNEQLPNLEYASPESLFTDDNDAPDDNANCDTPEDENPLWTESGLSNDNNAFNLSKTTVNVSQNKIKVGGDLSQKNMNIKDTLEQIGIQIGGELITDEEETE